jgi:hypothetical protein
MTRGGWREFRSGKGRDSAQFDVMMDGYGRPLFVRIRDRSRDDFRGRAYIVVDLGTLKVLPDQTDFRPRSNGHGSQKG